MVNQGCCTLILCIQRNVRGIQEIVRVCLRIESGKPEHSINDACKRDRREENRAKK